MSSDVLDLAIICPEAAKKFIENDPRFEIVGTCAKNSDVFVIKEGVTPKRIGIGQKRTYQKELVTKRFGTDCEVKSMMVAALPYALENGLVDAIVIDATKGWVLKGRKEGTVINEDYVTYVLLARKDFKQSTLFRKFIDVYEQSIKELEEEHIWVEQLSSYIDKNILESEVKKWRMWKIKLVPIMLD